MSVSSDIWMIVDSKNVFSSIEVGFVKLDGGFEPVAEIANKMTKHHIFNNGLFAKYGMIPCVAYILETSTY